MKRLLFFAMFIFSMYDSNSQRLICPADFQSKKTMGIFAVELVGGVKSWNGWAAYVGGTYYFSLPQSQNKTSIGFHFPKQFIRLNALYSQDNYFDLYHDSKVVDLVLGYTPFSMFDMVYASVFLGGTVSQDRVLSATIMEESSAFNNALKMGGVAGVEVSSFLGPTSQFAVAASFTQRMLTGDSWGTWRWYSQVGVRYHFTPMRSLF